MLSQGTLKVSAHIFEMLAICVEVRLGPEVSECDARQDRLCVAVDGEGEEHTDGAGGTCKFRVTISVSERI